MTVRLTVLCLAILVLGAPMVAADRYTVAVRLLPGDDLSLVASQLAATYGVQIEEIVEERGEVAITGSDARVRLLRTSPHAVRVDSTVSPLTIGPYGYDGSGNITRIGGDTFVYDSAGRIVSGTAGPARRQDYSYDAFGNLQTIIIDGDTSAPIRLHVDPATNRASAPSSASASFNAYGNYDAAGNMTSFSDAGPFVYDGLGMITDATVAGQRTVYLYTPNDERVASITLDRVGTSQWAEGRSEWTLRGADQKILRRFLRSAGGTWTWDEDYIYRSGLLLAAEVNRPEKTVRFHLDHLGTPRLITGNGGAEVSRHTYYPFGFEATTTTSPERLKFTGHERDQPNLDYMHARYYNGGWGRFLSVDPKLDLKRTLTNPQAWNRYAYVRNNPLRYVDPRGLLDYEAFLLGRSINVHISDDLTKRQQQTLIKKIDRSLKLLDQKAEAGTLTKQDFSVMSNIQEIRVLKTRVVRGQETRSSISESTGVFTMTDKFVNSSSSAWTASSIGHDALHVQQFNDAGGYWGSQGLEAEIGAMRYQRGLGGRIGLDAASLAYVQDLINNPERLREYMSGPAASTYEGREP